MSDPSVLIVDDEPAIRRLLRTSLVSQSWRVTEARTGKMALNMAMEVVPDIVVLDLGLPDMDGVDVLRRGNLTEGLYIGLDYEKVCFV